MKQRSSKWLALMLASLLPLNGFAVESAKAALSASAIDMMLPIHQQKKLHPEFSDPVLGDQAQIVEWAWSPQYAERFGLQPQADGLPNGGLWLVGIKIQRKQNQQWQAYSCNIVGLMDNRLKILTPPGEVYMAHPSGAWSGGLPGKAQVGTVDMKNEVEHQAVKPFTPAQATWYKKPKNKLEQTRPENGMTRHYLYYVREFQTGLSYFQIEAGSCSYFGDPQFLRNEIRFPTSTVGGTGKAVYEPSAIVFDLPDNLIRRIYPYAVDANDWTSCLMRRTGRAGATLTLHALKTKRFGNTCEPVVKQQK